MLNLPDYPVVPRVTKSPRQKRVFAALYFMAKFSPNPQDFCSEYFCDPSAICLFVVVVVGKRLDFTTAPGNAKPTQYKDSSPTTSRHPHSSDFVVIDIINKDHTLNEIFQKIS